MHAKFNWFLDYNVYAFFLKFNILVLPDEAAISSALMW